MFVGLGQGYSKFQTAGLAIKKYSWLKFSSFDEDFSPKHFKYKFSLYQFNQHYNFSLLLSFRTILFGTMLIVLKCNSNFFCVDKSIFSLSRLRCNYICCEKVVIITSQPTTQVYKTYYFFASSQSVSQTIFYLRCINFYYSETLLTVEKL